MVLDQSQNGSRPITAANVSVYISRTEMDTGMVETWVEMWFDLAANIALIFKGYTYHIQGARQSETD